MVRLLAAAALLSGLMGQAHAAFVIATPTASPGLLPGDPLEITLSTSADFPEFTGGAINVTYDASVLAYEGAIFPNPPWFFTNDQESQGQGASGPTTIENVTFAILGSTPETGATDIGTLSFSALAPGTTTIAFADGLTGFSGPGAIQIDVSYPEAVGATVVPLPAAAWMMISGLAAMGGLSYRQRQRASAAT